MKEFKVNPLNVIGSRRQECLLPHMTPIAAHVNGIYRHDVISWIEDNLKGRYWIGSLTKISDNRIAAYDAIAFEDPYESTIFLLSCPHLAKIKSAYS